MSTHAAPTPPDEPKTPLWLPAVGAALFILVGLWWAISPAPVAPIVEEPTSAASASAPAEGGQAAARPPAPTAQQPPPNMPPNHVDDARIKQLIEQARQKQNLKK